MGEHLPCKQGVRGSNPLISTVESIFHIRTLKTAYIIKNILILLIKEHEEIETSKVTKVTEHETNQSRHKIPDASYASDVDGQAKKSAGWMPWH